MLPHEQHSSDGHEKHNAPPAAASLLLRLLLRAPPPCCLQVRGGVPTNSSAVLGSAPRVLGSPPTIAARRTWRSKKKQKKQKKGEGCPSRAGEPARGAAKLRFLGRCPGFSGPLPLPSLFYCSTALLHLRTWASQTPRLAQGSRRRSSGPHPRVFGSPPRHERTHPILAQGMECGTVGGVR